jgi:hypothetical protein
MDASTFFDCFEQCRLQIVGVRLHLAGRDFFVGSSLKTKFTMAKPIFRTDRRTEDATSHGAGFIQLAHSALRIEHRARLIIGKGRKLLRRFLSFIQHSTHWISREVERQPRNRLAGTFAYACRTIGRCHLKSAKASPQASRVKLINGKHSNTTLRTSRAANQPLAASVRDIDKRGIHDLDERLILGRWEMRLHTILRIVPRSRFCECLASSGCGRTICIRARLQSCHS